MRGSPRGEAGAGRGDPATLAEQTGTGARWSPSGNCCLPGGLGGAEGLPCGSAVVIIYESWKLPGESFIFTRTSNVIVASEGKGTPASAWEARMQPCKMCH